MVTFGVAKAEYSFLGNSVREKFQQDSKLVLPVL